MSLFILYNKNIMFYLNLSKIIRKYKNFIKIKLIMLHSLVKFYFGKFIPSKVTCWNCKSNEFVNRFICG